MDLVVSSSPFIGKHKKRIYFVHKNNNAKKLQQKLAPKLSRFPIQILLQWESNIFIYPP